MTTLHLGVIEVPYATHVPHAQRRVAIRRTIRKLSTEAGREALESSTRPPAGGETAGDVAEILEAKYHIMELFAETHWDHIGDALAQSVSDAIDDLFAGAPAALRPTGAAESEIETAFKMFLSNREVESIGIPKVPTLAALKGINHRLLHPYAKSNPRRPSFIDTGIYQAAMKAWID